jgi:hypothetical protein
MLIDQEKDGKTKTHEDGKAISGLCLGAAADDVTHSLLCTLTFNIE